MNKLLLILTCFFYWSNSFAQEELDTQILIDNDSMSLINIYNINKYSSVLYIMDKKNNKIDTLGTPNGVPVRKSFYDGIYFTTFFHYGTRYHIVNCALWGKVNGKWKMLAYRDGALEPDRGATYSIEQIDIFTLIETAKNGYYTEYGGDITIEYKFDVLQKKVIRSKIKVDGRKEKMDEYSFIKQGDDK